jgi:hypothetical protein
MFSTKVKYFLGTTDKIDEEANKTTFTRAHPPNLNIWEYPGRSK